MPQGPHTEKHFTAGAVVRDIVIGMSDGLTVPFALAAGLSGAVASTAIVVTAGLAEVAAGSIAMGLGGYLAARSDAEHYANERRREEEEIVTMPKAEEAEVAAVFREYGLPDDQVRAIVAALKERPVAWVDFMMQFELGLENPEPARARNSALTCIHVGLRFVTFTPSWISDLAPTTGVNHLGRLTVWNSVLSTLTDSLA